MLQSYLLIGSCNFICLLEQLLLDLPKEGLIALVKISITNFVTNARVQKAKIFGLTNVCIETTKSNLKISVINGFLMNLYQVCSSLEQSFIFFLTLKSFNNYNYDYANVKLC